VCGLLLAATLLIVPELRFLAQAVPPFQNGYFEKSLSGWTVEGAAALDMSTPLQGRGSLRLGPGKSAVRQRVVLEGLRILFFEATLRTAPVQVGGAIRAQCYDVQDRLLLDLRQEFGPTKAGPKGGRLSLYFKTQAHTAYVVLSIEKETGETGYVYADVATVTAGDRGSSPHIPLNDLQQAMQPVWQGNTVYRKTVLLLSEGGSPAAGRLLFTPTRILSVRDYAQTTPYVQGKDYSLDGRMLTAMPGSHIPTF
jgi:hypothetical protein